MKACRLQRQLCQRFTVGGVIMSLKNQSKHKLNQNVKRIVNEGSTKQQALFYVKNKEDLYMSKKDEVQTDPTVLNPETKFGGGGGLDDSQK